MNADTFRKLCEKYAFSYEKVRGLRGNREVLQVAADDLWARAKEAGLDRVIGTDEVQRIMSEAFEPVRKRMEEIQ